MMACPIFHQYFHGRQQLKLHIAYCTPRKDNTKQQRIDFEASSSEIDECCFGSDSIENASSDFEEIDDIIDVTILESAKLVGIQIWHDTLKEKVDKLPWDIDGKCAFPISATSCIEISKKGKMAGLGKRTLEQTDLGMIASDTRTVEVPSVARIQNVNF